MFTHSALQPDDVLAARERIRSLVRKTPVMRSDTLNDLTGSELFFKCEHLQHTGSFKARGASHAVSLLPADCPGVATHSSGNHGAALAWAAAQRGMRAEIVVPEGAVAAKIENIRRFGGQVHFCAANQAAREAALAKLLADTGLVAIPPYDDDRIIAGQASAALELLEQVSALDTLIAPVGGGGLLAGTALAALTQGSRPKVIGLEPAGADDTIRSLAAGRRVTNHHPVTMADGLRAMVGERNLEIIAAHVDRVLGVDEPDIVTALDLIRCELHQRVEPSAAVALAGILAHPKSFSGRRVGVILSGGNLDLSTTLPPAGRRLVS